MGKELEQGDGTGPSLLKQFRDFGFGPIIGMLISMLTVPVTTRLLSPEEYGKSSMFTLFQSLFLAAGILGLDQGYVRFYNGKGTDRSKLLQNSLCLPLCLSALLVAICSLFIRPVSTFLFGSVEIGLMLAFCAFIPVLLLNRFFFLQIRMSLRGKLYSVLSIASQVINFSVLILFILFYQKTFRSIVYSAIVGMIINTCVCFVFMDKSFLKTKFSFSKELQKSLLKFSLPLVPATLLSWLLNSFDKVGLRSWSTFEELGLYAAALKMVALLNGFQNIFTTAWVPIAYKWHEDNVPGKKFEQVSSVVLALMAFLFSCIVVSRDIIMLFLGPEYRGTSEIFVFLLFVPVMYTVSETTCLGISFSKRTTYNLYVSVLAVALNLTGNCLLIPKHGALGAAVSTCASYVAFFWARTLLSRKVWFKFGLAKFAVNQILLAGYGVNILVSGSRLVEAVIFLLVTTCNIFSVLESRKQAAGPGAI